MKTTIIKLGLFCFLFSRPAFGQTLEVVHVHPGVSTHFIMSEPIQYVDISTDEVEGDIPVGNIVRIKPNNHETPGRYEAGIITIVCQKYMVQYRMEYADQHQATTSKFISTLDGQGLSLPEVTLSVPEMREVCKQIITRRAGKAAVQSRKHGMKMEIHQVVTAGDHFFMDVTMKNRSGIAFDTDHVRFHIQDKKASKATNQQQIEIKPEYQLYQTKKFGKRLRNVYVFKNFTFPNEKTLHMEVAEKQPSGRSISINVDYKTILKAATL